MTEFIINGTRAVLPDNLKFKLFEENPTLTQRGEFSLDITLSLEHPVNARIFKHINRLNNKTELYEATAVLITDNIVSNGKIIDILPTDSSVTFQYISGNSEVNYLGTNRKIWDFDWGTEAEIDFDRALFSIENPGYGYLTVERLSPAGFSYNPKRYMDIPKNFVCCPIKFSNLIANDIQWNALNYQVIFSISNICMQPYLLYYINKLPELLGFTMGENILNSDTICTKMYMLNGVKTLKYADVLPDISIFEFIETIEEFFNVTFDFDPKTNKLNIRNATITLEGKPLVKLTSVIDSYEVDTNDDDIRYDFNSIGYQLSDSPLNKWLKVSDKIMNLTTEQSMPTTANIISFLSDAQKNKYKIYVAADTNDKYACTAKPTYNVYRKFVPNSTSFAVLCNQFQDYKVSEGQKHLEIKLKLADFECIEFMFDGYRVTTQIPFINSELYIEATQNFLNAVENSLQEVPRISKIEVALFNGVVDNIMCQNSMYGVSYNFAPYPMSFIHNMPFHWIHSTDHSNAAVAAQFDIWITNKFKPVCNVSLSPIVIYNTYHANNIVSDSKKYIFKIIDNKLTISNNYLYNGLKFAPISLEKEVNIDGINKVIQGTFYKLK